MKLFKALVFAIACLVCTSAHSQNEYVQIKMGEIRKAINPTFQGATNGNAYFSYVESIKEAKTMKIVSFDKDLKPGKVVDYRGVYFGKPTSFGIEVVNDKLYGFYGYTKYPKYCLSDLGMEVFDLKTGVLAKPVTDKFKQSAEYSCDLWSITTVSSKNKKHTALIQNGLKPKALIWKYDENMKEVFQKTIDLEGSYAKFEPHFESWQMSAAGDLYICYHSVDKNGTVYYIAKITSGGSVSFTKVPLPAENKYAVHFTLDRGSNPIFYFTKAMKNKDVLKGMVFDSYGVIKFDAGMKVEAQCSLNIPAEVVNATKMKGHSIEGCHYLVPKTIFTRTDGSTVFIAEQDIARTTMDDGHAYSTMFGTYSIVVFIIGKDMKEQTSFVINKTQTAQGGGDYSSFDACEKSDHVYLFYNEDFQNESLPMVSFFMRVVTPDNKLTNATMLKEKGKQEKGNLNVKTDLYKVSEEEAIFIVSAANAWGSGNSDDYQLMSVKFLK